MIDGCEDCGRQGGWARADGWTVDGQAAHGDADPASLAGVVCRVGTRRHAQELVYEQLLDEVDRRLYV